MKKKSIVIIVISSMLVITGSLASLVLAKTNTKNQMSTWGFFLNQTRNHNVNSTQSSNVTIDKDIYAIGKNAVVYNKDIEIEAKFYVLSGMNKKKAKNTAIQYEEQRQALYQSAIANGYQVTDQEVKDYLKTLKETIHTAANSEEAMDLINQFDSEKDYWDFEYDVYKTDLPIQNYVHSLEKQYKNKSKTSPILSEGSSSNDSWNTQFEAFKEKLVQEQNYKIMP